MYDDMYGYGLYANDYTGYKQEEDWKTKWKSYSKTYTPYVECTHKELEVLGGILTGGKDKEQFKKADTLVLLDCIDKGVFLGDIVDTHGRINLTDQRIIYYPIRDMQVPENKDSFKIVIGEMKRELSEGKRIHVQCIGGHGRTGVVIASLIGMYTEETEPIKWTRENYCDKAVENLAQVNFVGEITDKKEEIKPSKTPYVSRWDSWKREDNITTLTYGKGGELVPYNKELTNKVECATIPETDLEYKVYTESEASEMIAEEIFYMLTNQEVMLFKRLYENQEEGLQKELMKTNAFEYDDVIVKINGKEEPFSLGNENLLSLTSAFLYIKTLDWIEDRDKAEYTDIDVL